MAAKTKTATLDRETVETELAEANAQLAAVHGRVAEGHDVTAAELADAEKAVQLATLRLAAVDEHERRRREQDREDALAALTADAQAILDGDGRAKLAELLEGFTAAAAQFLDEWQTQHDRATDMKRRARQLEPLPKPLGMSSSGDFKLAGRSVAPAGADRLLGGVLYLLLHSRHVTADSKVSSELRRAASLGFGKAKHPLGPVVDPYATDTTRTLLGGIR